MERIYHAATAESVGRWVCDRLADEELDRMLPLDDEPMPWSIKVLVHDDHLAVQVWGSTEEATASMTIKYTDAEPHVFRVGVA